MAEDWASGPRLKGVSCQARGLRGPEGAGGTGWHWVQSWPWLLLWVSSLGHRSSLDHRLTVSEAWGLGAGPTYGGSQGCEWLGAALDQTGSWGGCAAAGLDGRGEGAQEPALA